MIFQLEFKDKKEFAQAKNLIHLQKEYAKEYGEEELMKLKSITIIAEDVAKTITLRNNKYNNELPESDENNTHICLYDLLCGVDFKII